MMQNVYLFDLLEGLHGQFLNLIGAFQDARKTYGIREATGMPAQNYHASPPRALTIDEEFRLIGICHFGIYHPFNYAVQMVDHIAGVNEALIRWRDAIRQDVERIEALAKCDPSLASTIVQLNFLDAPAQHDQMARQFEGMTNAVNTQAAKILTAEAVIQMTPDCFGDLPFIPSDTVLNWLRDIHAAFPKISQHEQLEAAHQEYIAWRHEALLQVRRNVCQAQDIPFEEPGVRRASDSAFEGFANTLF
ncbi:MAG: hypothetical protein J0L97_09330 [Alphaproteobacteria bacterium]|nr:hypothetical protein [Alphaproteobacteria bacterium]